MKQGLNKAELPTKDSFELNWCGTRKSKLEVDFKAEAVPIQGEIFPLAKKI